MFRSSGTNSAPEHAPSSAAPNGPGGLGFAVLASERGVEFHLYGADGGRQHLVDVAEGVSADAVLMGRLYYRDDLASRFSRPLCNATDAELALAAYARGGIPALEGLEGEFCLVVHDRSAQHILALRDPLGGYPIYWRQDPAGFVCGTALRLVAPDSEAQLNRNAFAEILTLPSAELDCSEETVFQRVHRLTSGSLLTFKLPARRVGIRQYWHWPDHVIDPGTDRIDEVAELYGATLRAAVRERIRHGPIAAHLSGGMDSTSTALLAHQALRSRGEPLHALSLVYDRLAGLTQETPYIESALDRPGLVAHRLQADDLLDFDLFGRGLAYDEPYPGLFRVGTDAAMIDAAAAAGCRTILTGIGADEVLDTAPFYVADLIRSGRIIKAWSESAAWARAFNGSAGRVFGPFGLAPFRPPWLAAGWKALLRRGYAPWDTQTGWTIPPWVRPGFAAETQLQQRFWDRARQLFPPVRPIVLAEALGRIRYASGDWVRYHLGAPRGIHIAHPFRDPRVLGLGLGLRIRIRPDPHRQKPVLAQAMRSVLPEAILRRRDKTHFNAVYYEGLLRNLDRLEDLVRAAPIEELEMFDKDVLIRGMRDVALGYRPFEAKIALDNTLILIEWLTNLRAGPRQSLLPSFVLRREVGSPA